MKLKIKITITAIFLLISFASINTILKAQNSESNDVKLLVQQQIMEAKKRNNEVRKAETSKVKPVVNSSKRAVEHSNVSYGIPGEYLVKGAIMLTASIGVFFWLGYRKAKNQRLEKNNQFKRNIKRMREEKFIKEIDPKLKEIRTRLTLTSVVLNEDKKVSAAARKSQIGKEEILLASRIRSHEIQYGGQRSFA